MKPIVEWKLNTNYHRPMLVLVFALAFVLIGLFATERTSVYGAEYDPEKINEWEAQVLERAEKTMEYEGRVFYAYGTYLDELTSYLEDGDTDLTEAEAEDAISQMEDPNNVKSGAQSGYLYQIGGKPVSSENASGSEEYDGKIYPEFDENERFWDESEYRKSELYQNNKQYISDRTNLVYESRQAMRKEIREIALRDRDYRNVLGQRDVGAKISRIALPEGSGILFLLFGILSFAAVALCGYMNAKNGTIAILRDGDDEKWNRKNTRKQRQRIRKVSSIVLTVVVALNMVTVFSVITFYGTLGSDSYVQEATEKAGVCEHGFMEFRNDVHDYLKEQSIPQNALDLVLTFRDYRFDEMKGIRSAMKTGDEQAVHRGIRDSVQSQIDLMAYLTKKDSKDIVSNVNGLYDETMSSEVGLFVHDLRKSVGGFYLTGFVLSFIALAAGLLLLLVERPDYLMGVRDIAIGTLAGTGLWACVTGYMALLFHPENLGFADDNVYVTMQNAMGGIPGFMAILLVVSAVVSLLLLFTGMWMRNRLS